MDGSPGCPRWTGSPPARWPAWSAWPPAADHPRLRAVITGLPVAGFSGTLAPGERVRRARAGPALGVVRAKTGNLSTVATLAGLVYDASGRVLAFAFMTNGVPDTRGREGHRRHGRRPGPLRLPVIAASEAGFGGAVTPG